MANKVLRNIGIILVIDGIGSIYYFSFTNSIATLVRLIRTGIGIYLVWKYNVH